MKHWTRRFSGFWEWRNGRKTRTDLDWKGVRRFWNKRHEKRKIWLLHYPNKKKQ